MTARGDGSSFDHSWAAVIGIDAYRAGVPTLATAVADARAVAVLIVE